MIKCTDRGTSFHQPTSKETFVSVYVTKAYRGRRVTAPTILKNWPLESVSGKRPHLTPWKEETSSIVQEAGWAPGQVSNFGD